MELSFVNKPTNFYKYVSHVIDWNKIANNGKHDFSATKISNQKRLVREEYKELVEKGIEKENKIEVIDGLADLVVTAGYWMYLIEPDLIKNSCKLIHHGMGNNYIKLLDNDITNDRPWEAFQSIISLCHQVDFKLDATIQEVLRSNDTKIPTIEEYKNFISSVGQDPSKWEEHAQEECSMLSHKYADRYEGIHLVLSEGHLVFKDSNSKIIKPLMFSEANLKDFV